MPKLLLSTIKLVAAATALSLSACLPLVPIPAPIPVPVPGPGPRLGSVPARPLAQVSPPVPAASLASVARICQPARASAGAVACNT